MRFRVWTCVTQFFNLDLGFSPESVLGNFQMSKQKMVMKTGNSTPQPDFFFLFLRWTNSNKDISQAQIRISGNELDLLKWAGVAEERTRGLAR